MQPFFIRWLVWIAFLVFLFGLGILFAEWGYAISSAPSASGELLGPLGFKALVIGVIDFVLAATVVLGALILVGISMSGRRGAGRVVRMHPLTHGMGEDRSEKQIGAEEVEDSGKVA